jgi:hypothetical protein
VLVGDLVTQGRNGQAPKLICLYKGYDNSASCCGNCSDVTFQVTRPLTGRRPPLPLSRTKGDTDRSGSITRAHEVNSERMRLARHWSRTISIEFEIHLLSSSSAKTLCQQCH